MNRAIDGPLEAIEQRVLGCLLEKQTTVPASYPLTLTALRTACNQSSSRDPVTDYEAAELEECARGLKRRELLRVVVADRGQRTLKYHQRLDERLGLADAERALITLLLLRGAQSAGELRTRTERLHRFGDRSDVEACLTGLADRGLVREVPRRVGRHDPRWVHTLGPVRDGVPEASAPLPAADLEAVLARGVLARDAAVRTAYDAAAPAYGDARAARWEGCDFDRWLIDRVAEGAEGPIVDAGCGPGVLTAHLAVWDAEVVGYDLSPAMIEEARRRFPGLAFEVGDLRRLLRPPNSSAWGAIVAWYSLVYLAPSELPETFAGFRRVLRPGGTLAIGLFAGGDVIRETSLVGCDVDLELVLHDPARVRAALDEAGLAVREWYLCGAPAGAELSYDRLYVLADNPHA